MCWSKCCLVTPPNFLHPPSFYICRAIEIWLSSVVPQRASGRYVCPLVWVDSLHSPLISPPSDRQSVRAPTASSLPPKLTASGAAAQRSRHRSLKSNLQFKFGLSKGDWRNESWCQLVMEDAAGRLLGGKMLWCGCPRWQFSEEQTLAGQQTYLVT